MRVIAGALKGRRLASPRWTGLRPTSDRLRETLFNILGARVRGARVLDAYAGTGAVGIEAISRGAAEVMFVDADARATTLIARNVDHCDVAGGYGIIRGTLPAVVDRPVSLGTFDLILVDPPYEATGLDRILAALGRHLAQTGLLVRERSKRTPVVAAAGLELVRTVLSGDSALDFYRPSSNPSPGGVEAVTPGLGPRAPKRAGGARQGQPPPPRLRRVSPKFAAANRPANEGGRPSREARRGQR